MSDETPAIDITSFDRTDNLNSQQLHGARQANAAANSYFNPPFRPAPSAAAAAARFMRPTPTAAANTAASTGAQRAALVNIQQAAQAVQGNSSGMRSYNRHLTQWGAQGSRAVSSHYGGLQAERSAGFAQQLGAARGIGGPIPQAAPAPAPAPAAPPAPPGSPPGGAGGPTSGAFGPGHPFYATLIPAKPTSYPTVGRPDMPTQAPTAGLDLKQSFLATPGGKLTTAAVSHTVDAVGKALAEAAKPRQSAPTSYTTGDGWRSN